MDFAKFVADNRGKKLSEWEVDGRAGYLILSGKSSLEPDGKVLGLHFVASYDATKTKDLPTPDRSVLLGRAYWEFFAWRLAHPEIPGEVAMAQQEKGWGTQEHFHVHFMLAPTADLPAAGFEPQRYVAWESRLKRIEPK